jgi:superfamily II DNA or RNA helicase
MFTHGDRVRLKNNPAVVGIITEKPASSRAGRTFIEVELAGGRKSFPSNQLEAVLSDADPIQDLRDGKFSAPSDLRRAITHLRMTGRLADMIYSLGATNTEFHAYQFKPVLKLLNSPSRGLLIADEVGLGKTIEAGLLWTELVARFDSRRLLIICPKPLCEKWQDELRSKFNVTARICNAGDLLSVLKDDKENREGFAVIASLPAMRPPRGWDDPAKFIEGRRAELAELLEDADQDLFDLVVFDEAHHLRNTDTMNHKLAKLVCDVSDHKLFLSATPINLRANDLRALLKLIDPDTFEREWLFDVLQEENEPYVKAWEAARDPKTSIKDLAGLIEGLPDGKVLQTGKRLERLRDEFAKGVPNTAAARVKIAARLEEMSLLGSIINRTRRRDVAEFKVERRPQTARWTMTDVERNFYDTATRQIEAYAWEHDINERFLLAQTQRLLASSLPAAFKHWGERTGNLTIDAEDIGSKNNTIPGPLIESLGEICGDPTILASLETSDTKFKQLVEWLEKLRRDNPDEKLIIFSSFRRSISYLARRLEAAGFATMELHGGVDTDRQTIVNQFAEAAAGTILLTSEVGGEGLDLQFCRILFNWDIPWNPMRVEQRIGRIDRFGQQSPSIDIVNLIAADTIEEQVYTRLYERLGIIKSTLGDFEPILGDVIRDIEIALVNPDLTVEQRANELDRSILAAEKRKALAEELEREAPGLVAHGDSILQKINEAQAPHKRLTSLDLRDYIAGALISSYKGTKIERAPNVDIDAFDIRLSAAADVQFNQFQQAKARRYPTKFTRDGTSGVCAVFGSNPEPGKYRAIEAIPMTHPLSRFSAELLEQKQTGMAAKPVTAFSIQNQDQWGVTEGRYVVAIERWSVEGIVPVDKLAFIGSSIDGDLDLDEDQSERLLLEALGTDPRLASLSLDESIKAHQFTIENLIPALTEFRSNFENAEAARHYDLVETQRALIEEHREREARRMNDQIRDLKFSPDPKRKSFAYVIEKKLEKLVARLDLKLGEVKKRADAFSYDEPLLVGVAVIDVTDREA